jgi:hypothetical protein
MLCQQRYATAFFHLHQSRINSTNSQPPMKNNKAHQSFVRHTVPSRLGRTSNRSFPILAFIAVFAGCLLAGNGAHAATPVLRFSFEEALDTINTTSTNTQSAAVVLTNFDATGAATTNLHGAAGSGVLGQINNSRAVCQTNASYATSGGVNGPGSYVANSSTLASTLGGTVTKFTVTEWFNGTVVPPVNAFLGRGFVLGTGAANTDINAANTIGMKWQQPYQWNVSIGTDNPTATAIFPNNLPINKWLFMAIVYDGTNVMIYQGSDTASANLISTTPAALATHTTSLGASAGLYIGNRNTHQRAYVGWIDEFRFYTNASSASAVEAIRQETSPLPTITGVYPDNAKLMQATNRLAFNVGSPTAVNITNVSVVLNGVDVSSQLQYVTNGTTGTSTNLSVTYNGLQTNTVYAVVITVADANGTGNTYSGTFDTFNPANFVWEAEEFDFSSGHYIDNPDYTSSGTSTSYFGRDSVDSVDTVKGSGTGVNVSDYRAGAADTTRTQTPASTDVPRQRFLDLAAIDPAVVDHVVGNWSSAEWQNYTKTFPAGNYNIYGRISSSSSSRLRLAHITSGWGTTSQTFTNLGNFNATGSSALSYKWVPLNNSIGIPVTVNLSGTNTVRVTSGGGANANFYMLVPVNTNLPTISDAYPNGEVLFQPTNKLVFTASSTVTTISTGNITMTLNGSNVTSSLVFSGTPSSRNVSYTGLLLNQTYSAVINVTDDNGNSVQAAFTFDTWNPVFQVEAEDFDFSSGLYIDNPVPTTGAAGNSYFGRVGTMLIDESNNGGAAPYAGANPANYRNTDIIATTPITDSARQQFLTANASDYNVGFLGSYFWENYTKTWPTGTFNVYGRFASGAISPATQHMGFDKITRGWGTTNQFLQSIGTFNIPSSGGWSSYLYVPLLDQFGNYANVTVGGTNTFRATFGRSFGVNYGGDAANGAVNINFYMLVAARTDLARIDNVYPDGSVPMQITNTLSFVASSPNGINTGNIKVTLNGVNISSNLVFSGSSGSWNVSYPGLVPGSSYTAVIIMTDNNNQSRTNTVNFDTVNPNNFTWEAEDFDFDPTLSPVPNGSGKRYIDNPAHTISAATNSYFGQESASGIDVATIFAAITTGTYLYRPFDIVPTEVTSDGLRPTYLAAQLLATNSWIVDYDVYIWTNNGFINYTRTYPTGNFHIFARMSGGNGAFRIQCGQVTNGWGTTTQSNQYLGTFSGTGANFNTWQYVPLVNTNTSLPVTLSLGGTNTFQMVGDGQEHVNFFMLEVANPVTLTASISGTNILLSFPTQTGFNYSLSYKNNLTDPSWTPLGSSVTGNGMIQTMSDGISVNHRFYRLTIQ